MLIPISSFLAQGYGPVILPLERMDNGILIYCGGNHSNGNFPVGRPEDIKALIGISRLDLRSLLRDHGIDARAIRLQRQHAEWRGIKNPFVFKRSYKSPNVALSFSLEGGLKEVLAKQGSKRAKRIRKNKRRLERMGAVHYEPRTPHDKIGETLEEFYKQKSVRLKSMGICDVFADPTVRAMFLKLFTNSDFEDKPSYFLQSLSVDGRPAAIIGCTEFNGRLTVEFSSFHDDFAHTGPGEMLFFMAIENAAERGLEIFDFGVGDEVFKRHWCDTETWHVETNVPLNASGLMYYIWRNVIDRLVTWIKGNAKIWGAVKSLRKRIGPISQC